jgi:hypothetical protein
MLFRLLVNNILKIYTLLGLSGFRDEEKVPFINPIIFLQLQIRAALMEQKYSLKCKTTTENTHKNM